MSGFNYKHERTIRKLTQKALSELSGVSVYIIRCLEYGEECTHWSRSKVQKALMSYPVPKMQAGSARHKLNAAEKLAKWKASVQPINKKSSEETHHE